MDSLDGTHWDVVIAGTDIQQSLLALALSRSDLKVLHIDRNDYYGGSHAALSLDDARKWVDRTQQGQYRSFRTASIDLASHDALFPSRSYNLALAPDLVYTTSALLPALVAARVDSQIEFKAFGRYHVCRHSDSSVSLDRVPQSREDVFADSTLDMKTKGALVRVTRFLKDHQQRTHEWDQIKDQPFSDLLSSRFKLPVHLQHQLLSLAMARSPVSCVTNATAIPRIARHFASYGVFGPTFNAVVPPWGGLCEITQVCCRAGAVGGATYVLSCPVDSWSNKDMDDKISVNMAGGVTVTTRHLVGNHDQMPMSTHYVAGDQTVVSRRVAIIDSSLSTLFRLDVQDAPLPAATMVVFPSASSLLADSALLDTPIHVILHSSESGDCPKGQCVAYASVPLAMDSASLVLSKALSALLGSINEQPTPRIIWSMGYEQVYAPGPPSPEVDDKTSGVHMFKSTDPDPVFDDSVLDAVRDAWIKITKGTEQDFLVFAERDASAAVDAS